MKNQERVAFTEESVKQYLDNAIRYWRHQRELGKEEARIIIDVFQSVRTSLFGEILAAESETKAGCQRILGAD